MFDINTWVFFNNSIRGLTYNFNISFDRSLCFQVFLKNPEVFGLRRNSSIS